MLYDVPLDVQRKRIPDHMESILLDCFARIEIRYCDEAGALYIVRPEKDTLAIPLFSLVCGVEVSVDREGSDAHEAHP